MKNISHVKARFDFLRIKKKCNVKVNEKQN